VQVVADSQRGAVRGASYPGLPNHPSYPLARRLPFRGGFFGIDFRQWADRPATHHQLVHSVVRHAWERGVPLVAGASFGLDTTRICRTAATSAAGLSFVRIAPGTEHRLEVRTLERGLEAAILEPP
jgi:hypothetical protein